MAGSTGALGAAGSAGEQGQVGQAGPQGPVGMVNAWTAYRAFSFGSGQSNVSLFDAKQASEISTYMAQNPSLRLGIDSNGQLGNQDLEARRVAAVRNSLIQAGVPAYKIESGAIGDPLLRRNQQVNLLLISAR
ncbi:hypothetical protein AAFN88_12085 [Pelagibius sp. CAU 1746]|uniref:hypothetical protein n=1 Tax=Pelagibius sp. CAU 1746 TaxID=3140370 RepID=UPI00325BBE4D